MSDRETAPRKSLGARWREIHKQAKADQAVYRRHDATISFGGRTADEEIMLNSIRLIDPQEPQPPEPTNKEKLQDAVMNDIAYTMIGMPPLWACVIGYLAGAVALGIFVSSWAVVALLVITLVIGELLSSQYEGLPSRR